MKNPKVSVIIPVYNAEKYIMETIESVKRQTYQDLEIIVVDDGSTDKTPDLVKSQASIYIRQENSGVAAARNTAVNAASGEYLAFLDADDHWTDKKLEIQIAFMDANPTISYSLTHHVRYLTDELDEFPDWARQEGRDTEMTGYIPSTMVVRKADFHKVGYFDVTFKNGSDTEWFLRARDYGFQMAVIPENLMMKRTHTTNLTSNTAAVKSHLLRTFKLSMMRRKQLRVSVIIPVYNGAKYIKEAINSVLNQYFKPYEIIVINDGSTDDTETICQSFGDQIKYFSQENKGNGAARNLGVEKATGNYLAFIDADDLWMPERLRDGICALSKADSAPIVFGMMVEFYSPETDQDFRQKYKCKTELHKGIHPGTMLLKREDFIKVGNFSTTYTSGVTVDWLSRIEPSGLNYQVLPGLHMKRRIHYTNNGIVHQGDRSNYAKIIKERLKKRREENHE